MGKLFDKATEKNSLRLAWYRIRSNGNRSRLPETRDAVKEFEADAERYLRRIQKTLREESFAFLPQKGVLKKKASGGHRGIVMAPVHNRIVERAWLDCLQQHVPYVGKIIATPTSIGGVPDRSVPHGLALIREAIDGNKAFFVRADISGFFDGIPRKAILDQLSEHVDDTRFLGVLDQATSVILDNEDRLGEDRRCFPTDDHGVAQGSPLSPLFGNILLAEFDRLFNERGIACIRFIDDFLLMGEKEAHVRDAFASARAWLADRGLRCHDPFVAGTSQAKAQHGHVSAGFTFLGYDIRPGLMQPSRDARQRLLATIDHHIRNGKAAILDVIRSEDSSDNRQRYAQTHYLIDNVVRGWGHAFAYADSPSSDLDQQIQKKIDGFRGWFQRLLLDRDPKTRRRAGGVCLLADIPRKSLDELPFRFDPQRKRRDTQDMIVVSTDGSLLRGSAKAGKTKASGGWGVVFHGGEEWSGGEAETTSNRMELMAVIEALKRTPEKSRVKIRTDSQYVHQGAENGFLIKSNKALWEELDQLRKARRVNIEWLRGHAGDQHNERADRLANEAAQRVKQGQPQDAAA